MHSPQPEGSSLGHPVGALPLPERKFTLVRSCELGGSGPTRGAVGRLVWGLPLRREHSLRTPSAALEDLFFSLAQRRGFREYLTGLPAPRERNQAITFWEGAEPVAGAGMSGGAAAAVLLVRVALGSRAGQWPAA